LDGFQNHLERGDEEKHSSQSS